MTRPDLGDPEQRAAYRRELASLYRGWRWLGVGIVAAGLTVAFVRGTGLDALSIGLLALGWAILIAVIIQRSRHHRRRIRGDYQV